MNPADSETNYAYWTDPGNRFSVTYSLGVFHEIDFQASEGFRRIPHGGIETGGLLFGYLKQEGSQLSVQIEAFRPIECEHASGPSFNLSERDIAALREQIVASASDPEIEGMQVLGWFVAHTRSALEMNDRESALFGELFPGPGRLLLVVKPERFQATRFAFIMRDADGRVERDGTSNAVILPLPGRANRSAAGPAASIPAPVSAPAAPRPVPPPLPAVSSPTPPPVEAPAPSFWRDVPVPAGRPEPVVRIEEPRPEELEDRSRAVRPAGGSPSVQEIRRGRSEDISVPEPERASEQRITRKMRREEGPSTFRLILLLLTAAALGCAAGYLAYLQLPSATISLDVRQAVGAEGSGRPGLIVSWPPDETRDAIFASIRVDDGEAIPLSTQQKIAGKALVPVSGDNVKIELIAQRRWRDSRGIVRYVRAQKVSP